MHKRRFFKLADFIKGLKGRKLNMGAVATADDDGKILPKECDSAACAMGWTPAVFPRLMKWPTLYPGSTSSVILIGTKKTNYDAMCTLFNINRSDAEALFNSGQTNYHTPLQVARGLRRFVESGGKVTP